jgi:hypothetical protein
MRAWVNACVAQTGMANVFRAGGRRYFWEESRTEHADGAITGQILVVTEERPDGSASARRVATFRIDPDGTVARAPRFLRDAAARRVSTLGHAIGSGVLQ